MSGHCDAIARPFVCRLPALLQQLLLVCTTGKALCQCEQVTHAQKLN